MTLEAQKLDSLHKFNPTTTQDILNKFPQLLTFVSGPKSQKVSHPSSQQAPQSGSLVFASDLSSIEKAADHYASAVIVHPKLKNSALEILKQKNKLDLITLITSPNVYLAMAVINSAFFRKDFLSQPFHGDKIDSTARIHPTAQMDATAVVGPGVVIHAHVTVGANTVIAANSVIGDYSQIGQNCMIHPLVSVAHHVQIGNHCVIKSNSVLGGDGFGFAQNDKKEHFQLPHYGALIIEDRVHIGSHVTIDRGTYDESRIGEGTIIDNQCHFGHNVRIGKHCIFTGGQLVAGSVTIGDYCIFGGRTTVNGKVEIASHTTIAPLSGVNNDVLTPGVYGGYPLSDFKTSLKAAASFNSLPEMRKKITQILSHLGLQNK